jgi:Ni/Co efflux regulator RcnB
MLKTLSAALIAASVMLAPMASVSASAAQPATKTTAVQTQKVKMVKKHKCHFAKHHKRGKFVKHTRQYKKHGLNIRPGKAVKTHKRANIVAPKVRAN